MRIRVGILDIGAAVVVLIAILLPPRTPNVHPAFPRVDAETAGEISRLQARLLNQPDDCAAAEELGDLLAQSGYTDWALRVAGQASRHDERASVWRAYRSLSTTHADRVEIQPAYEWAERAVEACERSPEDCADHERVRLQIYTEQLEVGLHSGIDPQIDPAAFRLAISRAGIRSVRLPAPKEEPPQEADPPGEAPGDKPPEGEQ